MKYLIIIISILLFSTPVIGNKQKGETLYVLGEYPEWEWVEFGDKKTQPEYRGQVKNGKPDPESFLLALSLLNEKRIGDKINPEECLVFEDSIYGVEAAKKSKMRSIAVTTSFSYEELSGISDRVVDVISLQTLGSSLNLKEWFLSL